MNYSDNIQRVMELESKISGELSKDNGATVYFEFSTVAPATKEEQLEEDKTMVQAFTFNPRTEEFFLLHSAIAKNKVKALEAILLYVKTHKTNMKSYTVKWARKRIVGFVDDRIPENAFSEQISYFYCENPQDVLNKFYAGKDSNHYEIFELKLNPMS